MAAQEVSKCFTKKSPEPSMAKSRDLKTGHKALQTPDPAPETADSHTAGAKRLLDHSLPFKAFALTQAASKQGELERGTTITFQQKGETEARMSYASTDQGWRTEESWRTHMLPLAS